MGLLNNFINPKQNKKGKKVMDRNTFDKGLTVFMIGWVIALVVITLVSNSYITSIVCMIGAITLGVMLFDMWSRE